jgi:glycosyltransferase involved in cell wall biosynthesis
VTLRRILVIANLYPSASHPSFGTFVKARVNALAGLGVDVAVVAITDPAVHDRLGRKYASLALRTLATSVGMLMRRVRPDVVEAHIAYPTGLVALAASALLHRPLVLFVHGADITMVMQRSALHRRLGGWLLRRSQLIVANSEYMAEVVRENVTGVSDRIVTVSPGVEVARFARPRAETDRWGLLYVGRLVPQKGVDVLIEALANWPGPDPCPPLAIIGSGSERTGLEGLARRRGVAAVFLGDAGRDAVADAMASAAVVVVPSVYQEPLGLVAIEGMASGAVVVATTVGGLGPLIEDGVNGFLVAPGDPVALQEMIIRALEVGADPVRLALLRDAAATTARRHDAPQAAAHTLAIYSTRFAR